ncbi:aa3-type cytochrome c oxidase subunit IV [Pelagibacteraceae bacterium]|nr:aa3-type cytochrome c oxidase subunit IV [Pelagibacteraceae bacterium]
MIEQEHKNTWNGFTKFVLYGTIAVVSLLVILAVILL